MKMMMIIAVAMIIMIIYLIFTKIESGPRWWSRPFSH